MPWLEIGEFLLKLFTGQVWNAWQAHKQREANSVTSKVDSISDTAVTDGLRKFTKSDK